MRGQRVGGAAHGALLACPVSLRAYWGQLESFHRFQWALDQAHGMLLVYFGGLLRIKASFQWLLFFLLLWFSCSLLPVAPRCRTHTYFLNGQQLVRFGKLASALLVAIFSAPYKRCGPSVGKCHELLDSFPLPWSNTQHRGSPSRDAELICSNNKTYWFASFWILGGCPPFICPELANVHCTGALLAKWGTDGRSDRWYTVKWWFFASELEKHSCSRAAFSEDTTP